MNLLEAIEQAGDNWFRPILFKGSKYAYSFNYTNLVRHEFTGTSFRAFYDNLDDKNIITGEWEIVTPEQVISEMTK